MKESPPTDSIALKVMEWVLGSWGCEKNSSKDFLKYRCRNRQNELALSVRTLSPEKKMAKSSSRCSGRMTLDARAMGMEKEVQGSGLFEEEDETVASHC